MILIYLGMRFETYEMYPYEASEIIDNSKKITSPIMWVNFVWSLNVTMD